MKAVLPQPHSFCDKKGFDFFARSAFYFYYFIYLCKQSRQYVKLASQVAGCLVVSPRTKCDETGGLDGMDGMSPVINRFRRDQGRGFAVRDWECIIETK
jgi:hypothetical protein